MRTLTTTNGKSLKTANYKPQFGFKSLVTLLNKKMEYIESGKSRNTNSYYIECGLNDDSKRVEIRISDHTKYIDTRLGETHHLVTRKTEDTLCLDIVSKENFKDAKELILNFIN